MATFLDTDKECIFALATPIGHSAIAIIRVSGFQCGSKLKKHFSPILSEDDFSKKFVRFMKMLNSEGEVLDHIVLLNFPHPHSFTGDDVMEIQCHGSPVIIDSIFATLGNIGFRFAKGGEFTKRAFLNGKMDLVQAEAIQQLISANNLNMVRDSLRNIDGFVSNKINEIKTRLLEVLGQMEAHIDFPEDDIETDSREVLNHEIVALSTTIAQWLRESFSSEQRSRIPSIIIIGRPNVGKSTLFNALIGKQRSIVSTIAGTTRDYIQEQTSFHNFSIQFIDTAGIRNDPEQIEEEGIKKSKEILQSADLALFVADASVGWTKEDEDIFNFIKGKLKIIVWNKSDIRKSECKNIKNHVTREKELYLCAFNQSDIEKLKHTTLSVLDLKNDNVDMFVSFNQRQNECLRQILAHLMVVESLLDNEADEEIAAIKVRESLEKLAELTGENISESLLDHLFSQFCIGK